LRRFLAAGVDSFIDLTEAVELQAHGPVEGYEPLVAEAAAKLGRDLRYHRVPIRDVDTPTCATMVEILDLIELEIAFGHTVYLHCYGGVGRTATVVGAHLVRGGISGDAALAEIGVLRAGTPKECRRAPETSAQCELVRDWPE
jgi:protein-tyrosine phosphatase